MTEINLQVRGTNSELEKKFATNAGELLREAINKDLFEQKVKAHSFGANKTRWRAKNGDVDSKSNSQILEIVRSGKERDEESADNTLRLRVIFVTKPKGVVGSTTLGSNPIMTADWFFQRCIERKDGVSLARHWMHEWLHVAGFYHYPNNSAREDVPYVLGDIVRQVLKSTPRDQLLSKLNKGEPLTDSEEDELVAYELDGAEEEVFETYKDWNTAPSAWRTLLS